MASYAHRIKHTFWNSSAAGNLNISSSVSQQVVFDRFHECPLCLTPCVKPSKINDERKIRFLQQKGAVILMRGCVWKQLKRHLNLNRSPYSTFFYHKNITQHMIIDGVKSGDFFGFLSVDIDTPEPVRKRYRKINFPTIFDKISPTENMLSENMLELCKRRTAKVGLRKQLTLVYEAKNYLLTSEMLRFYLSIGMTVKTIHYCVEYQRSQPLKKFIELSNFNWFCKKMSAIYF